MSLHRRSAPDCEQLGAQLAVAEYGELREELISRYAIMIDTIKFGFTAVVAIWTIAVALFGTLEDLSLFATPFIFSSALVITWMISTICKENLMSIGKIAAYLQIFREDELAKTPDGKGAFWEGSSLAYDFAGKGSSGSKRFIDQTQYPGRTRITLLGFPNILELIASCITITVSLLIILLLFSHSALVDPCIIKSVITNKPQACNPAEYDYQTILIGIQLILIGLISLKTIHHFLNNSSKRIIENAFFQTRVNWYMYAVSSEKIDERQAETELKKLGLVKIEFKTRKSRDICYFWTPVTASKYGFGTTPKLSPGPLRKGDSFTITGLNPVDPTREFVLELNTMNTSHRFTGNGTYRTLHYNVRKCILSNNLKWKFYYTG